MLYVKSVFGSRCRFDSRLWIEIVYWRTVDKGYSCCLYNSIGGTVSSSSVDFKGHFLSVAVILHSKIVSLKVLDSSLFIEIGNSDSSLTNSIVVRLRSVF